MGGKRRRGEAGITKRPMSPEGAASLEGLELVRVCLPLRERWSSGAGSFSQRDSLLVRAVLRAPAGEVEGWGECPALPEPTYNGEYTAEAVEVSERFLVPALLRARPATAGEVGRALAGVKGHEMAKTAFEAAIADAQLRSEGVSMAEYFAGASELGLRRAAAVPAGVSVGLAPSTGALVEEVGRYVSEGYRSVKLKISPTSGPSPAASVGAVRERWPELVLAADANGAYGGLTTDEAAALLLPLEDFDLAFVEQPLGEDDLAGHARLAHLLRTPVCLDEALGSYGIVAAALEIGACSVVNVKAGRLGGYLEAVRAHDLCARSNVALRCGGMVETGIARAANVALASLGGFNVPGDVSAAGRFFEQDIAGPLPLLPEGTIAVPDGPGTGVEVDRAVVARCASWRRWWPAS